MLDPLHACAVHRVLELDRLTPGQTSSPAMIRAQATFPRTAAEHPTGLSWASWSDRRTRSRLSMSRRGRRSPRWWNATTASSGAAGAWGSTKTTKARCRPKRERKLARVRAGTAHAALVFDGDDCVGWCQFGAPDEVPRIKNRAAYEKDQTTSPDWRIACCYVGKGHRRQGVATAALAGAVDLIAGLGGGTVEGYPEDTGSVPAGFLYHGALSTYEQARVHSGPQDRQAPLGRGQGRRADCVTSRVKRHSRTLGHPADPANEYHVPGPGSCRMVWRGRARRRPRRRIVTQESVLSCAPPGTSIAVSITVRPRLAPT